MPKKSRKAFEEIVLEARETERKRLGGALASYRGTVPFGKDVTEEEQDELWMTMDANWQDDAKFLTLVQPKEQGGQGLTPLQASLVRWKNRADLMGVGVADIEEQIAYAKERKKRCLERGVPVTLDWGPGGKPRPAVGAPPPGMPPAPQEPTPAGVALPTDPSMQPDPMAGITGQEMMAPLPAQGMMTPDQTSAAPVAPPMTQLGG